MHASQLCSAGPPSASGIQSPSGPNPAPRGSPARGGIETAYAPCSTDFSSGKACARLQSRPVSVRAFLQLTRLRSCTSSRIAASVA
eukprot:3088813-Pleurochrysis_carterae.AAC.1